MGANAKKLQSDKRKAEKRAKKAREQALYTARRDSGINNKSKRFVLRKRRTKMSNGKHSHAIPFCGNTGCKKCFPRMSTAERRLAAVV